MTNQITPITLTTARLRLVGADVALLRADLAGRHALGAALVAHVADTWPPEYYDTAAVQWMLNAGAALDASNTNSPWRSYYVVFSAPTPTLVGTVGFKSAPDKHGTVEIGYSVVASFQRRGIASEAVAALIAHAYTHGATAVAAETFPELVASLGVMRRCGLVHAGQGSEAGAVRYVHHRGG
ncbi:MAG: GNAT family N-acetyltransferase [Rhodocyclaceae bacterium]|nr:GNAT family N-acetyltransferase [Rhodocyclaceae bacterium]